MSETERLAAELELSQLQDVLEEARDSMHADGNEANVAAYKEASVDVATARQNYRTMYRPEVVIGEDDAAPEVETVKSRTRSGK